MFLNRIAALSVLVCIILLLFIGNGVAWGNEDQPKAVLILVDRLSVQDLEESSCPNIWRICKEGAVGLMNTRTAGARDTDDVCVTIGAGRSARSGPNELLGFNVDDGYRFNQRKAGNLYRGLTGLDPGGHEVLLLNIAEIIAANQTVTTKVVPGALGESLREAGFKTCVLGNGDLPGVHRRNGVAVAMDARGLVDYGDVGEKCQVLSAEAPGTWETDYAYIEECFERYWDKSDFVVIELSDLARLEMGETALPDAFYKERKKLLAMVDRFVGEVAGWIDPNRDLLVLVSPSPSRLDRENKATLTPLILYGAGFKNGIVYSATTKRDYIAANVDIAPTVLDFFRANVLFPMDGISIESRLSGDDKLEALFGLVKELSLVNQLRAPLVKGYVGAEIATLVAVLIILFFVRRGRYARWVEFFVFAMACVPLVFLILPVFPVGDPVVYTLLAVFLWLILSIAIFRAAGSSVLSRFFAVALLTVLLLDVDAATGCHLIKGSVLGYDPASGARYYGIGNEFMGVLIGTTIVLATIAYQKWRNRWVFVAASALFALEVFFLANPGLGANAGGTIAAMAAFALTAVLMSGWTVRARTVLGIGALVLAFVALVAFLDMQRAPEAQSHVGRALNMIISGGWNEAYGIISRKLAMNIKLIRYTIWSRVFLVSLVTLAVLLYRPHGIVRSIGEEYPYVLRGLVGMVTGAFVALVFNDSGIVAAATTTIFSVSLLACLALNDMKNDLIT